MTTEKDSIVSKEYYERRAKQIVQGTKSTQGKGKGPGAKEKPPERKPDPFAEVIQLPLWPDPQRAAPNVLLRSALFAVVKKGERQQLKRALLQSWAGTEIRFTGEQLDQFDETVWFQAHHLAAIQARNRTFAKFKLGGFLRELGLTKTGAALKRLDASFTRMVACEVDIEDRGFQYRDNMLGLHLDKATGVYTVRLNPALVQLFDAGFTRVEWQTRLSLKTDLAKWLHSFVLTHRATDGGPQRNSVADLMRLSGVSADREMKKFRHELRAAMKQLEEFGVVKLWRITDNDALEFVRKQRKQLAD